MDQKMSERVDLLEQWIKESDNVVFFGGAGVSTESGIPDFRSVDGLYNQQYDYPPETIISHSFYRKNPEEFYRFYKNKMLFPDAQPKVKRFWNCMDLSTEITAPAVGNSSDFPIFWG